MENRSSRRAELDAAFVEICVQRLAAELPCEHPISEIIDIVVGCQRDLTGEVPESALPEMIERLARFRLRAAIDLEPPEPVG